MTRLILITHPAVEIDPSKPVDQWIVSKEGWEEVRRLIRKPVWKDVDVIYSSNERKALSVAEEITAGNINIKFPIPFGNDFLREIDRSSTQYVKDYEQAIQQFYAMPQKSYKGWETATDATIRITSVLPEMMKEHVGKTVVIISHGAIGTLLICWLKGINPTIEEDPKKQGCMIDIDWDNKRLLSEWIKY